MPRTTKSGKDKGVLPTERGSNPTGSHIFATSRQSRFHLETLESQTEIDLKTVNISIGDLEILVDADLKLKAGVRYALIGRNGTGKSSAFFLLSRFPQSHVITQYLTPKIITGGHLSHSASHRKEAYPGLGSNYTCLTVITDRRLCRDYRKSRNT